MAGLARIGAFFQALTREAALAAPRLETELRLTER